MTCLHDALKKLNRKKIQQQQQKINVLEYRGEQKQDFNQ